jgi:hypothetical protein
LPGVVGRSGAGLAGNRHPGLARGASPRGMRGSRRHPMTTRSSAVGCRPRCDVCNAWAIPSISLRQPSRSSVPRRRAQAAGQASPLGDPVGTRSGLDARSPSRVDARRRGPGTGPVTQLVVRRSPLTPKLTAAGSASDVTGMVAGCCRPRCFASDDAKRSALRHGGRGARGWPRSSRSAVSGTRGLGSRRSRVHVCGRFSALGALGSVPWAVPWGGGRGGGSGGRAVGRVREG